MVTKALQFRDKSLGGVHRFGFTIYRDGDLWDTLDSATVTFEKPDRSTTFTRNLSPGEEDGFWYYDTVPSDLDSVGFWTVAVEATEGAVVLEYPYEIGFRVRSNP